ncbi:hypothetical protein V493_02706, partial [Pseudogymnoascus sp. VKM F-4281 (FW-2241)]
GRGSWKKDFWLLFGYRGVEADGQCSRAEALEQYSETSITEKRTPLPRPLELTSECKVYGLSKWTVNGGELIPRHPAAKRNSTATCLLQVYLRDHVSPEASDNWALWGDPADTDACLYFEFSLASSLPPPGRHTELFVITNLWRSRAADERCFHEIYIIRRVKAKLNRSKLPNNYKLEALDSRGHQGGLGG